MEEEPAIVTPPSIERTTRYSPNRVYKTFPRNNGSPSTPTTASSESKAGSIRNIVVDDHCAAKANRVNITMTSTTSSYSSRPEVIPMEEDEDRMAETDVPFDQANETGARDTTTTSAFAVPSAARNRAMGIISQKASRQAREAATATTSPPRSSQPANFDDSKLSPVSNRFESIWLSSPEQSPSRPKPVEKATVTATTATTSASSSRPSFTKRHIPKKDEMDDLEGRFSMSQLRYSDPQPWSGSLSPVAAASTSRQPQQQPVPSTTRALKVPSQQSQSVGGRQTQQTSRAVSSTRYSPNSAARRSPARQYEEDMANDINSTSRSQSATRAQRYSMQEEQDEYQEEHGPEDEMVRVRSTGEDTTFEFDDGKDYSKEVALDGSNSNSPGKNVRVTHKIRRRTRQRREQQVSETDDDTSVENYGTASIPATSLQERTHQAWKSRQKKNPSLRSSPKQEASQPKPASQSVSFGKQNTVHHFQPSAHEEYERRRYEDEEVSVDRSHDRSLNSEYTKTLESEVEDMIKDILFIGNSKKSKPGRRKYKDRPEVRRKLRQQVAASDEKDSQYESNADTLESTVEDESTLPSIEAEPAPKVLVDRRSVQAKKTKQKKSHPSTVNDSTYSNESLLSSQAPTRSTVLSDDRSSVVSASSADSGTVETLQTNTTFQSDKNGDNDPFVAMVGLVEGGLSAVTSAIGYAFADTETQPEEAGGQDKNSTDRSMSNATQSPGDQFNFFQSCLGGSAAIEGDGSETNKAVSAVVVDKLSQDIWQNSSITKSCSHLLVQDEVGLADDRGEMAAALDLQAEDLKEDSKVSILALHAAHSVHKLQGVEYDESIPIDMTQDLKVCPVNLKLPLGIIFVENDGGCFVTKVSPDGSAARSGGVEVGDQLACINGASSLHMTVDDICDVIANSSDPSQVDLVFLRYIGPFRAANKFLLETEDNFRLDAHGSFNDSPTKEKKKPMWRKNPMKSNKKEPVKIESAQKPPAKKKGGFRLFGRGKN